MNQKPTGTPLARALVQAPEPETLPLEAVPCPGPRFGKAAILKATLMKMHGDLSFTCKDPNLAFIEAKKLGIKITSKKEADHYRIWRIK